MKVIITTALVATVMYAEFNRLYDESPVKHETAAHTQTTREDPDAWMAKIPSTGLCAVLDQFDAKLKALPRREGVNSIDRERIKDQRLADETTIYNTYRTAANQELGKGLLFKVSRIHEELGGYLKQGGVEIELRSAKNSFCKHDIRADALVHKLPILATIPEGSYLRVEGRLDPNREYTNAFDLPYLLVTKLTTYSKDEPTARDIAVSPVIRTAQEKGADDRQGEAYLNCKVRESMSGRAPWLPWNSPCVNYAYGQR